MLNQASNKAKIFALLEKDPMLTTTELAQAMNCKHSITSRFKKQWLESHKKPTKKGNKEIGAKNRTIIFTALDKNPNLSVKELSELTNGGQSTASAHKKAWLKLHPETKTPSSKELGDKYKEIIFLALTKTPHITSVQLAQLANCSQSTAYYHKQAWLKLHSAEPQEDKEA